MELSTPLVELLDSFEKQLAEVKEQKTDTKSAKRAIKIIKELESLEPSLPVMIEVPDAGPLESWVGSVSGADLSEDAAKISAALDVADVMDLDSATVDRAVKVLDQYRELSPSGSRYLGRPLTMTLPDGTVRRSSKGDWTSIRNQARSLTPLTKEDLNEIRDLLREGKTAECEGVRFSLG